MAPILRTKDLKFKDFLEYPDIEVEQNICTFITGASGSGKSTLLRLFNQSISQSEGKIFYKGHDLDEMDTIVLRQQILLCGQAVFLFQTNIRENFQQYFEFRGEIVPTDEAIKHFLNLCQIDFPLNKCCTSMSGGERARVYMAIHLALNSEVLMLDEPTAALDPENSENVIKNVLAFCREKGTTTIVVSHDAALAEKYAERKIKLGRENLHA